MNGHRPIYLDDPDIGRVADKRKHPTNRKRPYPGMMVHAGVKSGRMEERTGIGALP